MSWTEVKYALNDGLGTQGFMPLNKILANQRTLKATKDTEYLRFYATSQEHVYMSTTTTKKIQMLTTGSFVLKGISDDNYKKSNSQKYGVTIALYKNDEKVMELDSENLTLDKDDSSSTYNYYIGYSNDISFSPGDIFYVKFTSWKTSGVDESNVKSFDVNAAIMGELMDSVHIVV